MLHWWGAAASPAESLLNEHTPVTSQRHTLLIEEPKSKTKLLSVLLIRSDFIYLKFN